MQKLKKITQEAGLRATEAGLFFMAVLSPVKVLAQDTQIDDGAAAARGSGQTGNLFTEGGIFQTVTNILLFLVGAISVIMLIIGGFRYVVSGGDSAAVEGAKNTILYAIVGIVVAFLAYAAVDFVIESLNQSTA